MSFWSTQTWESWTGHRLTSTTAWGRAVRIGERSPVFVEWWGLVTLITVQLFNWFLEEWKSLTGDGNFSKKLWMLQVPRSANLYFGAPRYRLVLHLKYSMPDKGTIVYLFVSGWCFTSSRPVSWTPRGGCYLVVPSMSWMTGARLPT